MRLFLERARASRPGLPLTEDRLALAAEICRRLDGLPLAIELAAARVSVLGLREILSALESRRPLFVEARDRRAVPQRYLRTVVAWSHDLLHADEKALLHQLAVFRGGVPLSAVVATAARSQLDAARATQLLGALVDKSILTASFPDGGARYDLLDTVREYAVEQTGQGRQPERGPAGARRVLRDRGRRRADRASWARLAGLHQATGAGARQPLGGAGLRPRRTRPGDRGPAGRGAGLVLRPRRAGLRGAQLPRSCGLRPRRPTRRSASTSSCSRSCATWRPRSWTSTPRSTRVSVPWPSPAPVLHRPSRPSRGWRSRSPSRCSGDDVRAAALAEEARAGYGAAGDHWGVAASSLVRAQGAVHAGEISTVATMTAEILRHSEAIGYDVFVVPAMLLEAWVAERRNEPGAAEDAYRRALALAGRIGFADHVSFALAQLGSIALARGDTHQAEELCRQALAMAEAASASWLAAHARVQLARVQETAGDTDTAETLYRTRRRVVADAAAAPGSRVALRRARRQPRGGGAAGPGAACSSPRTRRRGRGPTGPRRRDRGARPGLACRAYEVRLWRPEHAPGRLRKSGVHVGEPADQQGGKRGLQDERCGLAPAGGGRDHRAGDDRAVDRRPRLTARILASLEGRRNLTPLRAPPGR